MYAKADTKLDIPFANSLFENPNIHHPTVELQQQCEGPIYIDEVLSTLKRFPRIKLPAMMAKQPILLTTLGTAVRIFENTVHEMYQRGEVTASRHRH